MKKRYGLLLIVLNVFILSCGLNQNFSKQKYTKFKSTKSKADNSQSEIISHEESKKMFSDLTEPIDSITIDIIEDKYNSDQSITDLKIENEEDLINATVIEKDYHNIYSIPSEKKNYDKEYLTKNIEAKSSPLLLILAAIGLLIIGVFTGVNAGYGYNPGLFIKVFWILSFIASGVLYVLAIKIRRKDHENNIPLILLGLSPILVALAIFSAVVFDVGIFFFVFGLIALIFAFIGLLNLMRNKKGKWKSKFLRKLSWIGWWFLTIFGFPIAMFILLFISLY